MQERAPAPQHNRLAGETSPYLLQHADNPVDWYPWGTEALARARREDRPILLSIGYSACHWCHVMERESFCDERTAALMNQHFLCIKVDREERPDLDEVYMAATLAMTGSGGWPMTVFLTPDQEPFFAGTYFPPEDGYGRPGFRSLLSRIAELWASDRGRLLGQAAALSAHVRAQARPAAPMPIAVDALEQAVAALGRAFDSTHGGFGPAPKFPAPLSLELLLRHHRRTADRHSLEMVTTTLDAMARGGIRDHLGGGFARYATDEQWLVPHFEKMLYDNAGLARCYAEAYRVTGSAAYARVAREILDWVLGSMQGSEGGLFSATDADSDGVEGAYYVWTPAEVDALLPAAQAKAFRAYYDVADGGNWEGRSILHVPRPAPEVALALGCSEAELEERLGAARSTLLAARARRSPPLCDDKVLTSWNGLMIGALSEGSRLLDEPRFAEGALRAASFLRSSLRRADGRLLRSYRAGRGRHDGVLEDYAFVCDGLVDLYEATGEGHLLGWALELARVMVADFGDASHGGFFTTARDHEPLLVRQRDGQDGALPSGNAVAARALARLSFIAADDELRQLAADALAAHGQLIGRAPQAFAGSLRVMELLREGPTEVVLVGPWSDSRTAALRRALGRQYLPNRIIVHHEPGAAEDVVAAALVEGRELVAGAPAAYVCRDGTCRAPVTGPAELVGALGGAPPAAR